MSATVDVLFEQRLLACAGFYKDKLDGLWGQHTETAALKLKDTTAAIAQNLGSYDIRSERNIGTLLPEMQKKAREIMKAAYAWSGRKSFFFSILSGTRTYGEQNVLFNKRPKVTNARGGQSNHNFGIAIDIGIFDMKGKYLTGATRTEETAYAELATAVKASVKGIEWGGDWKTFKDQPHYEFATGMTITQKRVAFEAGELNLTALGGTGQQGEV